MESSGGVWTAVHTSRGVRDVLGQLQHRGWWRGAIELHAHVKASIGDFVSEKIRGDEISGWASSKVETNNTQLGGGLLLKFVAKMGHNLSSLFEDGDDDEVGVPCILMWHIATCYCELAQQQQHDDGGGDDDEKNHRVAMALSKYCVYLVISAPRLLPGRSDTTKKLYAGVRDVAIWSVKQSTTTGDKKKLQAMESFDPAKYRDYYENKSGMYNADRCVSAGFSAIYEAGVVLGKGLGSMPAADGWEILAEFWALLYHAGVHRWRLDPPPVVIKMGWDYMFRIRSWKDLKPPAQVLHTFILYTTPFFFRMLYTTPTSK